MYYNLQKMMKSILLYSFLFVSNFAVAQENVFEFQPLRVHDTIKTISTIKDIDKINDNLFFTTKYSRQSGLFLIEKKENYWIVYDYNDFVSNYSVTKHRYLNKDYVSLSVRVSRSGNGINLYGWYLIFDIKNKSYLTLHESAYNADDENNSLHKCEASITFKNNNFTVKNTSLKKEDCQDFIENGTYKIHNGRLEKI